jgi:glycerol-3-phosphate acyltransferase PlsX
MTNNHNIRIAVDMMSGDFGLKATVPAVLMALARHPELSLILVGDSEKIATELAQHNSNYAEQFPNRIQIKHSSQVVAMDDIPVAALRRKPDSSMRSSLNLVKTQEATACVSAGNTGALMVIAKYVLRTLPGIDRPAILYPMPSKDKAVSVLDLGANIECSPEQLFQFAVMGSVLVSALENKDDPTIGLLNIGSEAIKGTEVIKTASKLIADCKDLNYYGFVEGNDIYKATVDVVVCDGFIGNVTLKVSEGLAKLIVQYVKQGFMATWWTKLIAWLAKPILQGIFNKVNPSKYNGASLLGLNGVVIKSHGGADALAFCSAITAAFMGAKKNIPLLIREKVALYLQDYQKV